jgi:hypothetical protein
MCSFWGRDWSRNSCLENNLDLGKIVNFRENDFTKKFIIGIRKLGREEDSGESWLLDGFLVARHFSKSLVQFVRNGFELFFFMDQLICFECPGG